MLETKWTKPCIKYTVRIEKYNKVNPFNGFWPFTGIFVLLLSCSLWTPSSYPPSSIFFSQYVCLKLSGQPVGGGSLLNHSHGTG